MELLNRLKSLIAEIDQADEAEITACAELLVSMHDRISVRAMPLALQRNSVMIASNSGDKATLRRFENSQYEEIRTWSREAQLPRGATLRMVL